MDEKSTSHTENRINCVQVAIDNLIYSVDKLYSYAVPDFLADKIKVGARVMVPFGRSNKLTMGVIIGTEGNGDCCKLKLLEEVIDETPLICEKMINLANFMKQKYFCTLYDALKLMIPSGMGMKIVNFYALNSNSCLNGFILSSQEIDIINFLAKTCSDIEEEKIAKKFDYNVVPVLNKLVSQKILKRNVVFKQKTSDITQKTVTLSDVDFSGVKLTTKQKCVIEFLRIHPEGICIKELLYHTGVGIGVVQTLEKKGFVSYSVEKVYRNPYKKYENQNNSHNVTLNDEQMFAYDSILKKYNQNKYHVSLLYGVTGSGKTSVFMRLIDHVHKDGKSIILMVPEIALTSQIIFTFKSRFGDKVAVFHSGLSAGERMDEFKRVQNGEATIVIGTRSAVFTPVKNLGLIVMDEEQEYSYKSDSTPRYHARDIAKYRCFESNALLLLASATPSLESFYLAKKGKYSFNKLTARYGNAVLPNVEIIDMNKEAEIGNLGSFSGALIDKIKHNIQNNRQAILLLNRRGFNTHVSCRSCGEVVMCPNCSIPLTYHSANGRMMCHYCGHSMNISDKCPSCKEPQLKYSGMGTQKVEQELKAIAPDAKILRMDADTTQAKASHEKKLKEFSEGKYDIMIGTQMVAKGLDFPGVTLVGILSADQSLYSDDFRSFERTFSLLTQVIGRAGRATDPGVAVIQTFTPENHIINLAAKQDYEQFYNEEIEIRQAMLYPPFANICVVGFTGPAEFKVERAANEFFEEFKNLAIKEYKHLALKVLGPSPASILKINNKYRYKIIIKFKDEKNLRMLLSQSILSCRIEKILSGVKIFIDINPDTIM